MLRPPSHDAGTSSRRLPVTLAPHADELLSSWISRHASFYAIPPLGRFKPAALSGYVSTFASLSSRRTARMAPACSCDIPICCAI